MIYYKIIYLRSEYFVDIYRIRSVIGVLVGGLRTRMIRCCEQPSECRGKSGRRRFRVSRGGGFGQDAMQQRLVRGVRRVKRLLGGVHLRMSTASGLWMERLAYSGRSDGMQSDFRIRDITPASSGTELSKLNKSLFETHVAWIGSVISTQPLLSYKQ